MKGVYFFFLLQIFSIQLFSQGVIDSLEIQLKNTQKASEKITLLSELCWQYRRVDQARALVYGKQAVNLSREISDKTGLSKSLNDLSIIYMDRTQLDSAIVLLNEALVIRKELKDSVGEAAIYIKLGIIYQNRFELSRALENALKALELYEQLGLQANARTAMNNIGIIHYNLHNYDKSLEIHSQLLKLRSEAGDEYGLAQTMLNIGNVQVAKGDTLKGIDYYNQASVIFRKLDRKEELAVVLINLAAHQNMNGEFTEARKNLLEGLAIRRALNNPKEICSALVLLGELNTSLGKYDLARKNLREAIGISRQFHLPAERLAYQKMAMMFRALGNADSVFYYLSKYEELGTRFYEENLKNEVTELQTKYETEKKERAIATLSHQNTAQQLSITRQRLYFGAGAFVLLLLGSLAWHFQRSKRFKERIELERKVKEEQDRAARAIIETELNERKRIAAELHDGLAQTFAAARINLSQMLHSMRFTNAAQEEVYHRTVNIIEEGCNELRNISHTLIPEALLKKGLPDALRDLVKRINRDVIAIHLSIYGFQDQLDSAVETSIYRIIQECLSNTLKHSGAKRMDIQITIDDDKLQLTIEDNGKGFEMNSLTGDGIGLQSIKSRVNLLSGDIEIDSKPGKGTFFSIILPLKARYPSVSDELMKAEII